LRTAPGGAGRVAVGGVCRRPGTLRQAIPSLAAEATRRLTAIDWKTIPAVSDQLGAVDRLTTFFQVAAGARPPSA